MNPVLKESQISPICEMTARIEKGNIMYRLVRVEVEGMYAYALFVSFEEEYEAAFLGSIEERARDMFDKISRNLVTPCTLFEIIEDFYKEMN